MMIWLLFPILIIIIGVIVGIVFLIRAIIKSIEKEYLGADIISFFFPLVGLIIYAINVGKNDILAKSCVKVALLGVGLKAVLSFVLIVTFSIIYSIVDSTVVELAMINF